MTIIIQHEYWNLKIYDEKFEILLSFSNVKVNLSIPFNAIISFADPYANFGLKLQNIEKIKMSKKKEKETIKNNY